MEPTGFDDHPSETGLDNYSGFDCYVINDGDINRLREKAEQLIAGWMGVNEAYNRGITL
jgi:hypothetical protein